MTKTPRILVAGLLSTSMLVGAAFAANVPAGTQLADDQTFTYRVLDEHSSVDPQVVEDVSGSEIVRDLFEGLFNQDADGNLVPGVALDFVANDDNTQFTFNLRQDAKWSNGEPVTAGDFVYAWRRLVDPELASPYQWFGEIMNMVNVAEVIAGDMPTSELGVSAPDDHTLVVNLSVSTPHFPLMTTHASTFPSPKSVIDQFGAEWIKPGNIVSNGAYVLTEHVPSERSVRERNTMYWDNANTVIDKVVALVINDENVAFQRYEAGELDRTEIPSGQYPQLKVSHPDEATVFPRLCSYYYNVNLRENGATPLQDVRVRQALSMAIDRDIITENVTAGGQFPAYTFTPAATAGFEVPDVEAANMSQAERDAAAKALLAEAGYPDGFDTQIIYNTSEGHKRIAIAISQMWKQKLGVNAELANQEWQTFLETRGNGDFQIARAGWCGDYNEASTFLDLVDSGSGYNDSAYNNPAVDALLDQAKVSADRQPIYTQIEQIIADEVPIIPIYHYTANYMLDSDLGGWPVNNVEQNWYSKDLWKIAE
jgi:oligopeptide transport system substrate-binding protein